MHRTIEASIPSETTAAISRALVENPNVIHLSVHTNTSRKAIHSRSMF
ncbi:hypothetical protein J8J42_04770 [Chryseobacterium sp. cx-311]|nr:hypothetical protein [Marnyiella aurantia]MBP0612359.1 hypothetical protein [Marnyiella aurantia]